eukprot:CAMPEP_0168320178 /NCGR_PEP_ID=MMETSP0213-20121227/1497_1 /TAXON_ID=151035 /ORGANISM="Euplotes harpa, Strain FSP1.4" /LENGTH=155 /DNA_ID=CAMNT_0008321541 /DNA_START=829 /DNA_END=1297 /DNA_ORIENTATION=+
MSSKNNRRSISSKPQLILQIKNLIPPINNRTTPCTTYESCTSLCTSSVTSTTSIANSLSLLSLESGARSRYNRCVLGREAGRRHGFDGFDEEAGDGVAEGEVAAGEGGEVRDGREEGSARVGDQVEGGGEVCQEEVQFGQVGGERAGGQVARRVV